MISEGAYIELMKNCSKWNERACNERKARLRYPFFDQQTGTAHRFNPVFYRLPSQRCNATDAHTIVQYVTQRWRRRQSANSSDAIEMKMFLRDNPALDAALNTTAASAPSGNAWNTSVSDVLDANFDYGQGKGTPKGLFDYNEEGDDDASNDDGGSDEDDWGSKRKSRKAPGGSSGGGGSSKNKKKASDSGRAARASAAAASAAQDAADEANNYHCTCEWRGSEPVSAGNPRRSRAASRPLGVPRPAARLPVATGCFCLIPLISSIFKLYFSSVCSAAYKSLAGLAYHKAFQHNDPLPTGTSIESSLSSLTFSCLEISPLLETSSICDLCLGSKNMNKKTMKPEDLVVCHDCGRSAHPSCLSFNENVPVIIKRYGWQCIECKSCTICGTSENDDKLLFCDDCDRGYHTYCFTPKMKSLPENEYSCALCIGTFGARASAVPKKTGSAN
ncbi:PHD-finger [Ancylostoma caninum]|uniref:PHD-finger n=1 Tax=Ancylostoma caninum TaxID=29170 RepID=A0A368FIT0_ANCCA|nr:PHD-finger [Ancylostoma caninum]